MRKHNRSYIRRKIYHIKRVILDFFYPNRCPFCDEIISSNEYFHAECIAKITKYTLQQKYAVFVYDKTSKPLIYKAKMSKSMYAASASAKLICDLLQDENVLKSIDVIVYIPPKKGNRDRNDAPYEIAKEISGMTGIPILKKFISFRDGTNEQKNLSYADRKTNLINSVLIDNSHLYDILDKNILLIDDVSTTGATLENTVNALVTNGAGNVTTAVVAKTVITDIDEDV